MHKENTKELVNSLDIHQSSDTQSRETRLFLSGIDGLKAFAIIGVTLFHMFPQHLPGGYLGVSLFLLLTGYLLAYRSMKNWCARRFSTTSYFIKRIKRIYPALIVVILTTIGAYHFWLPESITAIRPEVFSILGGYNNWWQIHQNADYFTRISSASPFTHLWFMAIEIQYFIIWPILFGFYLLIRRYLGNKTALTVLGLIALASAAIMPSTYTAGQDVTRLYYGTDTRIYALLFGAFLGLVKAVNDRPKATNGNDSINTPRAYEWQSTTSIDAIKEQGIDQSTNSTYATPGSTQFRTDATKAQRIPRSEASRQAANNATTAALARRILGSLSFIILTIGMIASYLYLDGQYPIVYKGGMLAVTFGFCFMVILATNNNLPIGKFIDTPVLKWLGAHSYAIFLWQYPVLFLFQRMGWDDYFQHPVISNGVAFIIILLLTLWTDALCDSLTKINGLKELWHRFRNQGLTIVSSLACLLMIFGVVGVVQSANSKAESIKAVQDRIEANAAALQAENDKAFKIQEARMEDAEKLLDGVSCIGDSVMLGSAGPLRHALPNAYIDAKVSRYVGAGLDIARKMDSEGRLGKVVLIGLGTNGPITGYYQKETEELIKYLGPDREIFWVNIYGPDLDWQTPNNQYLAKLAKEHKNVTIIDWHGLVSKHKNWLSADGVHPNDEGIQAYATLVRKTMLKRLYEKQVEADHKHNK